MSTILVIEDNEDVNLMLTQALTDAGYGVKSAYNGIDGIKEIKNCMYDLVLLDIMLPYKSGDEILKEMRGFSEIPVIVISAKDMVGILSILIILLASYIIFFQFQLRNINQQLTKRLTEHTRQPISLELINKELNALTININKCLKTEENLRLDAIREEKRFKEMIANISHDLRTPLTAIKGYQQLMEKGMISKEQLQKLQIAQKHAGELGRLIEHFFEYTYIVNSESVIKIERINLTNLVTECLAESINLLEENNLKVRFYEMQPVFVQVDKEMTVRIIQNLIRNCVEHSDSDIEVGIITTKNAIISFKNFVKNPSELDVKQLFDRFYTSDKSRSKTTGLGLSIVSLLAEQMGGSTGAALQDGQLEIRVELPLWERA